MGHEIVYCHRCKTALTEKTFKAGLAVKLGYIPVCMDCVPPAERGHSLIIRRPPERPDPPSELPSPILKPIHLVYATGILLIVCLSALILLLILSKPEEKLLAQEATSKAPSSPKPVGGKSVPPLTEKEQRAKEALDKSRAFRDRQPRDLEGQVRLCWEAVWKAEQTPLFEVARQDLQSILELQRLSIKEDLAKLEEQIWVPRSHEQFEIVFGILLDARRARRETEWADAIDRLTDDVNRSVDELYQRLKGWAIEARRRGDQATVNEICDRIGRWGMEAKSSDLARAMLEQ